MAVVVRQGLGTLLLAIYLILVGIVGLVPLPLPHVFLACLALIAGILLLAAR